MTTTTNATPAERIAALSIEECFVCDKPLDPYEARMMFPGHDVQMHVHCGETPRTFYQPHHEDAGHEAYYFTRPAAEDAIKAYADDEEFKDGNWEIQEAQMTPAAYFQLPEFDGF